MSIGKGIGFIVAPALLVAALVGVPLLRSQGVTSQPSSRFELVEATIADVHRAIQQGQITCRGLVDAYVERARAYNGVSDRLVTGDGAAIPASPGAIRAGSPVRFPTETVPVASL